MAVLPRPVSGRGSRPSAAEGGGAPAPALRPTDRRLPLSTVALMKGGMSASNHDLFRKTEAEYFSQGGLAGQIRLNSARQIRFLAQRFLREIPSCLVPEPVAHELLAELARACRGTARRQHLSVRLFGRATSQGDEEIGESETPRRRLPHKLAERRRPLQHSVTETRGRRDRS